MEEGLGALTRGRCDCGGGVQVLNALAFLHSKHIWCVSSHRLAVDAGLLTAQAKH